MVNVLFRLSVSIRLANFSYDNSFRSVDTKDNPLGLLLGKEQIMGYIVSIHWLKERIHPR